ncbi:MAG: polyphosphate kinase 1 [Caldilineaceae bacterium]
MATKIRTQRRNGTIAITPTALHLNGHADAITSGGEPATKFALPSERIAPPKRVYTTPQALETLSLEVLSSAESIYNYELSWLDFNWRVLSEAFDPRNPLLERLRFIAITANNLDEFFSKRVGGLKRQKMAGLANLALEGWAPDRKLQLIGQAARMMVEAQSECLRTQLLPALTEHGMRLFNYAELSTEQQERLQAYFLRDIYPILTPLAIDPGHPFPFISNLSLSLGVMLHDPTSDEMLVSRLKVPTNRPRWVQVDHPRQFVPLEQIITANLHRLYPGMDIVSAYTFRVTRNADIARNEEEADDLLEMINGELRERRVAPVVRLEVDASMPEQMLSLLAEEMELEADDIYPIQGPMRLTDLFPLADVNLPFLKFEPWTPMTPPRFAGFDSRSRPGDIFTAIRHNEILVHHPYHSFATTTQQFIEAAARDPQVLAIKQTLYRTSSDSAVVAALIEAAENGKQVAVLVEVKARFDEAQNINWAHKLEAAGCHVAYGLVGLKTHTKISLVIRQEDDGLRPYFHIGTGNYNSKTSNVYTDLGFFSCNSEIASDLMDLFNYLTGYSRQNHYRKLLVAPVNARSTFEALIDAEIKNAQNGNPARIIAKMNGMDDPAMTRKLYEASQAGVKIDLIVRGNCRIRPGIPGVSENVRVISVIGRFLEHSRVWYFENYSEQNEMSMPKYYIGSADWMRRNLSNRVEAIVPIEDPRLQEQLYYILQTQLSDYRQAWEMLPDARYRQRRPPSDDSNSPFNQGTHAHLMNYTRASMK